LSANTQPPNLFGRIFIGFLKNVVQTPIGIKVFSITRYLYRPDPDNWVDINRIQLELVDLPGEFDGYLIVQISDFHLGTWLSIQHLTQVITKVNQIQPDLVVITGDFVTIEPELYINDLATELARLTPREATLAILGNHDHWSNAKLVRSALKSAGIIELCNSSYTISRNSKNLHIAGIDDFMVGNDRLNQLTNSLPDGGPAILLAHEPDFADFSSNTRRFILQLSGHSHGGQIIFPGLGPLYLPRFARKYPAGLKRVNGMLVYTTNGLGTAEVQIRYKCRPEIVVFELHSAK
jgi:uncharacterized protein